MAAPMSFHFQRAHTTEELQRQVTLWRGSGQRVGFVPTMGALHEGHLALVQTALAHADRVVASIFVNPTQFAPHEDFNAYPRTLEEDCAALQKAGCHLAYIPHAGAMYPDGFATTIRMDGPALGLESERRPHFFGGVATVVTKLFQRVKPDVAVFGEKDFQQLQVIRQLVRDLDLDVRIVGAPTVREETGLAMSSRNRRLLPQHRDIAPHLHRVLQQTARWLREGESLTTAQERGVDELLAAGFEAVDYIAVREEDTLAEPAALQGRLRILGAAHLGDVRLIDNIGVAL